MVMAMEKILCEKMKMTTIVVVVVQKVRAMVEGFWARRCLSKHNKYEGCGVSHM